MLRMLLLAILLTAISAPVLARDDTMQFEKYYMVFLIRGDNPPQLDEAAAKELQAKHIAHLERLWREGYSPIAGPFGGEAHDPLRGIVLFRGDLDIEEVRKLAAQDPAVQAGRLKVEVRPWYVGAGYMVFPKTPQSAQP